MASSDSQPQRGRPKIAELPDVHINTGAQSSNTETAFVNRLLLPELLFASVSKRVLVRSLPYEN